VSKVKPQLIYTAKEIVDSRTKADRHDTVEQVKQTTENANVAVQQTQYTAIHAEVQLNTCHISTICFPNLDQGNKMIIFQSILTTFIASAVFRGSWGRSET
jgi:hypothetical protein